MQVTLIEEQNGKAIAVQCNVQDDAGQTSAFERHIEAWGSLDVAILNAGIMEKGAPGLQRLERASVHMSGCLQSDSMTCADHLHV